MQFKPAVTALVTAVALASLLSGCKKEEAAPAAPPPQVGVVTLQPQAFTLTSELPGRTTAFLIAEVRPQVNGIIRERKFKEGSTVRAGALLYQIDPKPFEVELQASEAALDKALAALDLATQHARRIATLTSQRAAPGFVRRGCARCSIGYRICATRRFRQICVDRQS